MAKIIEEGSCPSCLKKRKLCDFRFGIIRSTICTFCLEKYLHSTLNPAELEELQKKLTAPDEAVENDT